jgi:hypothetical protein
MNMEDLQLYERSFIERLNDASKYLNETLGKYSRAGTFAFISEEKFPRAITTATIPAQILVDDFNKNKVFETLKKKGLLKLDLTLDSLRPEDVLKLYRNYNPNNMFVKLSEVRQSKKVCDAWRYYVDALCF